MKIKDIKVGDECWFLSDRIRVIDVDLQETCIVITYDIITDLFNNGQWSFHVFYKCDWERDIESFEGRHVDDMTNDRARLVG